MNIEKPVDNRRFVWGWAIVAVALTMLPYLYGMLLVGAGPARAWYSWLGYNLDDVCVYLSWMRQAADGHFFQRNLFTTDPQIGHQFNLFFVVLGGLTGLLHLSPITVYHISRVLLGLAFLRATWWLIQIFLSDRSAQRCAYLLVCFSAGLGWLPGLWHYSGINSPVDVWQPEAITFLCLYLSPLFLVSLLLMAGTIGNLWKAEKERRVLSAFYAGLCGLALGNIHTYDVITLSAIWGGWLVLKGIMDRRIDMATIGRTILAGAMTAISTGYTWWIFTHEAVFARRVAVPTTSPPILLYILAYAPLLILSIYGIWRVVNHQAEKGRRRLPDETLFLITWMIINLAVAYAPVSFNRKMLMGEHVALALLGGIGLSAIITLLPMQSRKPVLSLSVLLLFITNGMFLWRDANNFQNNSGQTNIQRPYLYEGEKESLDWIRQNTPRSAAVQPIPWVAVTKEHKLALLDATMACFTPGLTGHPVNAGHWGDTPDFAAATFKWVHFMMEDTKDQYRRDLILDTGVRYLIFSQKRFDPNSPQDIAVSQSIFVNGKIPSWLHKITQASNGDADVYEVIP